MAVPHIHPDPDVVAKYDEAPAGRFDPDLPGTAVDLRVEGHSAPHRFVWPAELDPMARIAGLHRVERCEDWRRRSVTGESPQPVTVWRKG